MITPSRRTRADRPMRSVFAILTAALTATLFASVPMAHASGEISAEQGDPAEAAPKVELTKKEKAKKARELAPILTPMLADPGFPSNTAAMHVDVDIVVYMGGFHLSTLSFATAVTNSDYEIRSRVQTEGIVDTLVKTDATIGARGQFLNARSRPALYNSDITDRKQRQLVSISYLKQADLFGPAEILSFPQYNLKRFPVSDEEKRRSVDPMSAIMQVVLAASQNAASQNKGSGAALNSETQNPCGGTIPVFDGRRRFDLIMKHVGTEDITTGRGKAYEGEAVKCWIGFKRVAGYKPRKKRPRRTDGLSEWPDLYMWLAPIKGPDVTLHMPVRFYAETGIGNVVARATRLVTTYGPPDTAEYDGTTGYDDAAEE